MKVLGIIAEYNPFHNGHRHHLEQSLAVSGADCSVAVMSGNFLQRGEPALWDKRIRAKMAVTCGIDLVVELPFAFACNNAEQFAFGGVSLLSGLGCVTDLAFGCEGDFETLFAAARRLAFEDDSFQSALASGLDKGLSFPAARTKALAECGLEEGAALLTQPNNILAVEYMKQCIRLNSRMKLHGIPRQDHGYNNPRLSEVSDGMASARAIRQEWLKTRCLQGISSYIPKETLAVLESCKERDQAEPEDFYQMISAKIRTMSPEELSKIWAVSEGLENLMKKTVLRAVNMEMLVSGIKSKRYTRTRIQRALVQTLVGLTRRDYQRIVSEELMYAHVLAFNEKGAALLKHIKEQECAAIPIYSNLSKQIRPEDSTEPLLKYDLLAADLYHLAQGREIYGSSDLVFSPFFHRSAKNTGFFSRFDI